MCHRRSHRYVAARQSDAGLRASQEERERVVERLRDHAGEGRLELDELEARLEAAFGARTRGDLRALLADLPEPRRAPRGSVRPSTVLAFAGWLPLVAAILILALAPPAVCWLGWPLLGLWLFAGLPVSGAGLAWSGYARRRQRRSVIVQVVAQAASEVRRRMRAAMEAGDHAAILPLLAPDVIVRSPIIGTPFEGADPVGNLFAAILDTFQDLEYTAEAESDGLQVLAFRARVRDRTLDGVDLIRVDANGLIAEITVLMRPMTDLAKLANVLGPRLARRRGRFRTLLMRLLGPPVPLLMSLVERVSPRLIFLRDR